MSFIARLHAYQDLGPYETPVLSEAWYEISDSSVQMDSRIIEQLFKDIATAFAAEHGDELDPGILWDFNWGDFIEEIPNEFLGRYGVHMLYGNVPQEGIIVFVHHDELLLR